MDYYEARNAQGKTEICFRPQRADEVFPYDFSRSCFVDISQHRERLTRTADWWLPVPCVTSLIGGRLEYLGSEITLRLSNGPYGIKLSGADDDFLLFAEQLKRAFGQLEKIIMKLSLPPRGDMRPFFRALKAQTLQLELQGSGKLQHMVPMLESIVLNQTTSIVEIGNKLTRFALSQMQLLGEPNTALLELRLTLEIEEENAIALADRFAKWLFCFRNLKRIEISGDIDVAFMAPFLKTLRDTNQQTRDDPGLAAKCMIIEFADMYAESDSYHGGQCIPRTCEKLVWECVKNWKGGFLWIKLGHELHWKSTSEFRERLQYEAARKWIIDAWHLGEIASRQGSQNPETSSMNDICEIIERAQQHAFPPDNFRNLFPETNVTEIPITTEYLRENCFICKMLFDLVQRNPKMLTAEEETVPFLPARPQKRSRDNC